MSVEVGGNGRVVFPGMRKRLGSKLEAGGRLKRTAICFEFCCDCDVVCRVDHDGHMRMILGGAPQHRRPSNINIFDGSGEVTVRLGDSGAKGVKVDDQEVDWGNLRPGAQAIRRGSWDAGF
jgi:hypothetical protein